VTDGQTDGQTDRILITIPRLHYMQRGKNELRICKYSQSVRLSVCQTCASWQNGRKICPYLYTIWNIT